MKKLNKIYLYSGVVSRLSHQINGIAAVECKPSEKDMERLVEFINISEIWHDAKKECHPEGVSGNNPVIVVGLRNGRLSYRHLWEDMEDCCKDIELVVDCKAYNYVLWAYLRDIVPGVKPKGF